MICSHRKTDCLGWIHCRRDNQSCGALRLLWCKGLIGGLFVALAVAFFAYGIVYCWKNAEDRVEMQKKITASRIETEARMDDLERKLNAYNETNMRYWKFMAKKEKKD